MSPLSPEPEPKRPADAPQNEAEDKVVETFTFDVSAGNRAALDEPQATEPAEPIPPSLSAGKHSARQRSAKRQLIRPPRDAPTKKFPLAAARVLEQALDVAETDPPKKSRRSLPSWTVSLALHAAVLLLLSFYTLATLTEEEDFGLYASTAPYEEVDDFQEIDIDPSEDLESLESELISELTDPGEAAFGDLSAESSLSDVTGDTLTSDSLGDLGNLLGDTGAGLADVGDGPGGAATASFFGTQIQANRIVYVVDNSGGMRHGQLETLIEELLKSVDSLTPKQMFYVIFYSDALYPLFYPEAPQNFVRATDSNKQLLRKWLDTVEFCLGNVVDEAVAAALSIRPEVIYLLTDGDLDSTKDQRRMKFMLVGTGGKVPIHTFGMGTGESGTAASKLKQVAEVNGGTFRAIVVSAEAKRKAKQDQRPYRKSGEPGTIWGRSFAK